ncbi:outer membrane lipoprotein-sorting protein [Shewanella schlegeliana]|uniref:Outer membrane lipoprotein-sorting protein n=1 Tax=Shewanella schlegeliana TaxID=190308 RepID=A0ABS1T1H1_9GAMM|nr:outer membrane lipoprotein-sorting protein [Shewanella schlegeliana]MBL4914637.1 outer membrane lipoprotein-sorting protein [Shewanella schlegeliana]MCL1109547.1 outer membrane lipoprotein-sorting protein [Shewanella schlegeliana]GIU29653.1 outer membrane lipoprotein-sorting protein [Shewanella schlegeliana]
MGRLASNDSALNRLKSVLLWLANALMLSLALMVSTIASDKAESTENITQLSTQELVQDSAQDVDQESNQVSAHEMIQKAMDNWRGLTSSSLLTMVIHRPSWERSMTVQGWTEGDKKSLVRITEPKVDAGNAFLIDDKQMWSYSPKINRVIKVPSSMMNQSWMGSDFSNKDVSRTTELLEDYSHRLIATDELDGYRVYTIESIPHESAPVVWGKQITLLRDDWVMLRQEFWDQDDKLVKAMECGDIESVGHRSVAMRCRMSQVEKAEEWTEIRNQNVRFDITLPDYMFTLSNLRNPR